MSKGVYEREKIWPLASMIKGWIDELGGRTMICGSVRRECSRVGDIDIVTTVSVHSAARRIANVCNDAGRQCCVITKLDVKKNKGAKVDMIVEDVQFNLYAAMEEYWGAMTMFLTGSKLFNILIRGEAKKYGYKLSQYGLFHMTELVAGRTEEQIFEALGLEYMPPKDRDMKGVKYDGLKRKDVPCQLRR